MPVLTVLAGPDGYLLRYSEGASFLVDPRGGHVEVQWVLPVPIGIVYVLGARSATWRAFSSTPMDPRPALLALVRNTYCSYLLDAKMREREFDVLSQLVKQGPVRGLSFGDNLDYLASSCRALARETRGAMVG